MSLKYTIKHCSPKAIRFLCETFKACMREKRFKKYRKHFSRLNRHCKKHNYNIEKARRIICEQKGGVKPLMRLISWKTGMEPDKIEFYVKAFNGLRNWGLV